MSNLKIDGNVLHVIQRTNNPSPKLSFHLTEETPYSDDFIYLDPTFDLNYQQIINEANETGGTCGESGIQAIKFHNWEKQSLAFFMGALTLQHDVITEIDLSNNYISNDSAELLLRSLIELPELKEINLNSNDIGDQMTQFITENVSQFTQAKVHLEKNLQPDEIFQAQHKLSPIDEENARAFLGELADEFNPGDLLYGLSEGLPEDKERNPVMALKPQVYHQLLFINPYSDWVVNKNNLEGARKKDLILFHSFLEDIIPSLYPKDEKEPFLQGWCKLGFLWTKANHKKIYYVLDEFKMAPKYWTWAFYSRQQNN